MALRTLCFCDGKFIGIETIYTVIDGKQINIPDKLKELRIKSKNNQLFCPCGCGSNLILVAGDRNLKEQHFRLKNGKSHQKCRFVLESRQSIDSKIVLKCWLDDKLKGEYIESRVPIRDMGDGSCKHEFTFLSRDRKIALSYCHERANLSDEKLDILENNSRGIEIVYIVDSCNSGTRGQYPERLMKIQDRQGYCLYLSTEGVNYFKAELEATVYLQNIDGVWQEISLAHGLISDYEIDDKGKLSYKNERILDLIEKAKMNHLKQIEYEKARRVEFAEKQNLEEEKRQEEIKRHDDELKKALISNFSQQETWIRDAQGNRWIKCKFCNKIGKESEFVSYGGEGQANAGTCYECYKNNPEVRLEAEERVLSIRKKHDANICPKCGGTLREKNGWYGRFMGCSNYPSCRFTRKIKG